jgi:hypothetical protein
MEKILGEKNEHKTQSETIYLKVKKGPHKQFFLPKKDV